MARDRRTLWFGGAGVLVAGVVALQLSQRPSHPPGPASSMRQGAAPATNRALTVRRPSNQPMQRAIVVAPQQREADIWFGKGTAALSAGRTDEAIAAFQKATRLEPDWARAHHNLGFAYDKAGRDEEAAGSYRLAILLDPSEPETHNNLGGVYVKLDRYEDAVKEFQQAIALKREHAEAHLNLGIAYLLLGDADRAQDTAAKLARLNRAMAEELERLIRQAEAR